MVSVHLIPQGHYEKCFTISVALVKLVSFTRLNLATWQKKDLYSMFEACYYKIYKILINHIFLHIPKILIILFQDHLSYVTSQMSSEDCHMSLLNSLTLEMRIDTSKLKFSL